METCPPPPLHTHLTHDCPYPPYTHTWMYLRKAAMSRRQEVPLPPPHTHTHLHISDEGCHETQAGGICQLVPYNPCALQQAHEVHVPPLLAQRLVVRKVEVDRKAGPRILGGGGRGEMGLDLES